MAQPLLRRQMNTTGALDTPAKFMPTWNSPVDDVPSPKNVSATSSDLLMAHDLAVPTRLLIWVRPAS